MNSNNIHQLEPVVVSLKEEIQPLCVIDIYPNPVRFYINGGKAVPHIGAGVSSIECTLLYEIKENYGASI